MKRTYFDCLLFCLTATFLFAQSNPRLLDNRRARAGSPVVSNPGDSQTRAGLLDYGKLPLSFEANHGQSNSQVRFLSRTGGYSLFLTSDELVLRWRGETNTREAKIAGTTHGLQSSIAAPKAGGVLRMKLRNANPAAKITGLDELDATANYFIGNDPAKWYRNVPTYAKVKYEGIYPGIDLVYYGNQRQLEYDFIVAPGAEPRRIAFDVRGAKRIHRNEHGELVLKMGDGEIRWQKPVAYQEKNGTRQEIAAHYAIRDINRVGFELAKYDASRPLYIDPLFYSTYLGGSGGDSGESIAVDGAGNAYVTGSTSSTDFPTKNPLQPANGGGYDAFVAKIDPAGSALVYSTYLGGRGDEFGATIAVDSAGNAYVTGSTSSTDFPTKNPLQPANGGGDDAFVAKIDPAGSALVYSTYLGGSRGEGGSGIAVDSAGNAYVTGPTSSIDFPTKNPLQPENGGGYPNTGDAYVSKINAAGSALVYSTYLGGRGNDRGSSIAVDSAGNAYVTGHTSSFNFPVTPGAFQTTCGDVTQYWCDARGDAFVSKLNPSGSALVYSTYLGGYDLDRGYGIAVDSTGSAYVTGETYATNFPTMNALQPASGRPTDAFVSKLNPSGSDLVYSTYLGGKGRYEGASGIAVDNAGSAYVTGTTDSCNFPTVNAFQPGYRGGAEDAFVSKFTPSGSGLVYSTYLGAWGYNSGRGIAVDSSGNVYVTGITDAKFPTKNPLQPGYGGGYTDAFVAKIDVRAITTSTLSSSLNPSAYGEKVTFTAAVTSNLGAPTDGETVTFKKGPTVLGTGVLSGGSASLTTSTLPVGNNSMKVVYDGDSNLLGSTSRLKQVVNKAASTIALFSSQNPSSFGQSVTFTASVAPQFSGTVKGAVTFYDGTTILKTKSLSGGAAKFTTAELTSGTHTITATYNESRIFRGSSASLTQIVQP